MNNKIDWKKKLTSRKLWMALAGLISGLVLAFNGSAEVAEIVSGSIMSVGSVVGYLIAEGLTDAAAIKQTDEKAEEVNN
jgi:hypothetical protein